MQPAGYTNIASALRAAMRQLNYLRKIPGGSAPSPEDTWTILITDGHTNRGPDPLAYAGKIPILYVIQTPPPTLPDGEEIPTKALKEVKMNNWFGSIPLRKSKYSSEAQVVQGETNPFDLVDQDQRFHCIQ